VGEVVSVHVSEKQRELNAVGLTGGKPGAIKVARRVWGGGWRNGPETGTALCPYPIPERHHEEKASIQEVVLG
jgi:hypothetical protein